MKEETLDRAEEIFNILKDKSGSQFSYRLTINLLSPKNEVETGTINRYKNAFNFLKARKIIDQKGDYLIFKDNLYDAIEKGGLKEWLNDKRVEEVRSRNKGWIKDFVYPFILVLIPIAITYFIDRKNDKELRQLRYKIQVVDSLLQQKDAEIQKLLPRQKEIDSLLTESLKVSN